MTVTRYTKPAPPQAKPTGPEKRVSILYVEDEDVNWEVTLAHLRENYLVQRARNAEECFKMLRQHTFHAILMDIQLKNSDLDGIEITKVLRGTYKGNAPAYTAGVSTPHLPIIFMTAYAARYRKSELQAIGGDELVTKPIDFLQLSLCLTRCLLRSVKTSLAPPSGT